MSTRKFNSRVLRQLAEELFANLAEKFPEANREDFVTSLVRQWITYDGNATFFVGEMGEMQIYLVLGQTPLGKPYIHPEPDFSGWLERVQEDWNIDQEDFPGIIEQLNRGQSAEVVNREGVPLRLWVDPKERKKGVEELVTKRLSPGWKRDYHKIAADQLEQHLGFLDEDEMHELVCSLAKQWQQYQGHACLFLDRGQKLIFVLTEREGDGCKVAVTREGSNLESFLSSLGFSPEEVLSAVTRLNLGQQVEFRDQRGIPCILWCDPKERRVSVYPVQPVASRIVQPVAPRNMPPIFCPKCTAVLCWQDNEQQKTCRHCGHTVRAP